MVRRGLSSCSMSCGNTALVPLNLLHAYITCRLGGPCSMVLCAMTASPLSFNGNTVHSCTYLFEALILDTTPFQRNRYGQSCGYPERIHVLMLSNHLCTSVPMIHLAAWMLPDG